MWPVATILDSWCDVTHIYATLFWLLCWECGEAGTEAGAPTRGLSTCHTQIPHSITPAKSHYWLFSAITQLTQGLIETFTKLTELSSCETFLNNNNISWESCNSERGQWGKGMYMCWSSIFFVILLLTKNSSKVGLSYTFHRKKKSKSSGNEIPFAVGASIWIHIRLTFFFPAP